MSGEQGSAPAGASSAAPAGASSAAPTVVDSAANKKAAAARKQAEVPIFQKRNWMLYYYYVRQKFDQCRDLIKVMKEETNGISEYGMYVEGLLYRVDGKILQSLESFRKASQLDPKSADTKKQIGVSLFLLGRHQQALAAYEVAEQLDKLDWEIKHNKGMCYAHMQEPHKAREEFLNAIRYNQALVTFKQLGTLYEDQKEDQAAIDIYEQGLRLYPGNSDLLTKVGLAYLRAGSITNAFEKLGTAVMFSAKNSQAMMAVGSIMQQHGDVDPALDKYSHVAMMVPESPYLWNNLGMCYFSKEQWATSIACLKRANYLAPLEWKINYNLGLVHLAMQQDTSAFHFLKSSVHLNPRCAKSYMLLAIALTRLNEDNHAEKCYEKSFRFAGDGFPMGHLNFATFLARQNKDKEATKQMQLFFETCERLGEASQVGAETLAAGATVAAKLGMEQTAPKTVQKEVQKKVQKEVKPRKKRSEAERSRRTSGQPV